MFGGAEKQNADFPITYNNKHVDILLDPNGVLFNYRFDEIKEALCKCTFMGK
jgi:hypothetical protein